MAESMWSMSGLIVQIFFPFKMSEQSCYVVSFDADIKDFVGFFFSLEIFRF